MDEKMDCLNCGDSRLFRCIRTWIEDDKPNAVVTDYVCSGCGHSKTITRVYDDPQAATEGLKRIEAGIKVQSG